MYSCVKRIQIYEADLAKHEQEVCLHLPIVTLVNWVFQAQT